MKAIILAAGRGKRLGALTSNKPKCLIEVMGKTLLEWQIETLRRFVKEIGVVKGYKGELINFPGVRYFTNYNWENSNMMASLMCARDWISEETIVSYSDILYSASLIEGLIRIKKDIVVPYLKNWHRVWKLRFEDPLEDAESFRIDNSGRLLEIGTKVKDVGEIEGQFMGIVKFTLDGWEKILKVWDNMSQEKETVDTTTFISILLQNNIVINTFAYDGFWFEIDRPEDITCVNYICSSSSLEDTF